MFILAFAREETIVCMSARCIRLRTIWNECDTSLKNKKKSSGNDVHHNLH